MFIIIIKLIIGTKQKRRDECKTSINVKVEGRSTFVGIGITQGYYTVTMLFFSLCNNIKKKINYVPIHIATNYFVLP